MKTIIEREQFNRTLKRMTHEIIEKNDMLDNIILVGIEKKGVPIAKEIKELIKQFEGVEVLLESIDIVSHRDDHKKNEALKTQFINDINDKIIILVDDVLYTGRTVRAALEAVLEYGRPKNIQLATLIDRGHRELPIRADYVGKNIPTSQKEVVNVYLTELDKQDAVVLSKE